MRRLILSVALVLVTVCAERTLRADTWAPPQSDLVTVSAKGDLTFTVLRPNCQGTFTDWELYRAHSTATPLAQRGSKPVGILEKRIEGVGRVQWMHEMINPELPRSCLVTSDGRRVVTCDTWGALGTYPVVVYDEHGKLVIAHSLTSLGLKRFIWTPGEDDQKEFPIKRSASSVHWSEDAIMQLSADDGYLVVRLWWGHFLAVRLADGALCPARLSDRVALTTQMEDRVDALLASTDLVKRLEGLRFAGYMSREKYEPVLRRLLDDSYSRIQNVEERMTAPVAAGGTVKRRGQALCYPVRVQAYRALQRMKVVCEPPVMQVPVGE